MVTVMTAVLWRGTREWARCERKRREETGGCLLARTMERGCDCKTERDELREGRVDRRRLIKEMGGLDATRRSMT